MVYLTAFEALLSELFKMIAWLPKPISVPIFVFIVLFEVIGIVFSAYIIYFVARRRLKRLRRYYLDNYASTHI